MALRAFVRRASAEGGGGSGSGGGLFAQLRDIWRAYNDSAEEYAELQRKNAELRRLIAEKRAANDRREAQHEELILRELRASRDELKQLQADADAQREGLEKATDTLAARAVEQLFEAQEKHVRETLGRMADEQPSAEGEGDGGPPQQTPKGDT